MIRFNRFNQRAALCALLLCFSLVSAADDIQDANKLFKKGDFELALGKIDSVLLSQPKDAQARFLKGLILTEQGQLGDAVRIFTVLSEDYPEMPEPYNNLAVLYAAQGQYEKAKTTLETALRTNRSYATAHDNLGDIYAQMASQAYDRALQLDRSNTSSKPKLVLIKDLINPVVKSPVSLKTQIASAVLPASAPVIVASSAVVVPAVAVISKPAPATAEPIAAKTAEVTVASTPAANLEDEVLKAVHNWAGAWSARNVNKYLAMYAKDFKTPNNESRGSWEKQRQLRIDKPQPIVVSISNANVKVQDANHAVVSFIQSYRSGTLKSTTRKTLEMIKNKDMWQIQSEYSGSK